MKTNYIEQAIRKAESAGWKQSLPTFILNTTIDTNNVFLDPDFWIALGKALGWRMLHDDSGLTPNENTWITHWHGLIDHLAAGKDAESYFKEILQ